MRFKTTCVADQIVKYEIVFRFFLIILKQQNNINQKADVRANNAQLKYVLSQS